MKAVQDAAAGVTASLPSTPVGDEVLPAGVVAEWDATTGKFLRTIAELDQPLWMGALSHDGTRYVVTDKTYRLMMLSVETGKILWTLDPDGNRYNAMRFSADGKKVATGSNVVKILNCGDGELLSTIPLGTGDYDFSRDGKIVATQSAIYDATSGAPLVELENTGAISFAVAISPDAKLVATGRADGEIWLFAADSGQKLMQLEGHTAMLAEIAFSSDSSQLFSTSVDTTVRLWDVAAGKQLRVLGDHDDQVYHLAVNADASLVASFGISNGVLVWAGDATPPNLTMYGSAGLYPTVAFLDSGREVVAKDAKSIIHVWNARTGQELREFVGHTDDAGHMGGLVVAHPNRPWFATGGAMGEIDIMHTQTGEVVRTIGKHSKRLNDMAFSPHGDRLATAGLDSKIAVWNVETGESIYELDGPRSNLNQVDYSPDEKWIAASLDRTTKIWHAEDGQLFRTIETEPMVDSIAFSPISPADDKSPSQLACGCRNGEILFFDPASGAQLRTLKGRASWIMGLRFSRDGKRLWSMGVDQSLTVWNLETDTELLALRGHRQYFGFDASPDGRTIATASADGTVKLWETEAPSLELLAERRRVDRARRIVNRHYSNGLARQQVVDAILAEHSLDEATRELCLRTARVRAD